MSAFSASLSNFRPGFDEYLENYLDKRIEESKVLNTQFTKCLLEIKRISMLRGAKRLRPALANFGYLINQPSVTNQKEIYDLGCALELFHGSALIYDDIIDEGLTRRGQPTIEAHYQSYYRGILGNKHSIDHLAMSSALLAGDLAQSMADSIISTIDNSNLREFYFEMAFELVGGQLDDCFGVGLTDLNELKEESIIKMLKTKSGNYSIQKPILMGMILAGVSKADPKFQAMSKIGENIGLIFQFTDDILGIFGNEDTTGKSNTSDIIEGKKTLLMLKTYQMSNDLDCLRIRSILGNKNYKIEEINWLKEQVITTGTLKFVKDYCLDLHNSVYEIAQTNLDTTNSAISSILDLSKFLLMRST